MSGVLEAIDTEAAPGPCPDVVVTPAQRPRIVLKGSIHPAVRDVQRRLNAFHLAELVAGRAGVQDAPLAEDCIFGKHTLAGVLSFQRQVFPGQPAEHDGKVGPKTWAELDRVALQPGPLPIPFPVPPVTPLPTPLTPGPSEPFPVPLPPIVPAPAEPPFEPRPVEPAPPVTPVPDIPAVPDVPVPEVPAPTGSILCDAIADAAEREFQRWRPGGVALHETDAAATPILQQYYREGVSTEVSAADLQSPAFQGDHPWSAVFVSFVMRRAGAGNRFHYARAHQAYIRAARRNRLDGNAANPFWAFRPTEVAPRRGDLVCQSRAGSGATFDNIGDSAFRAAHCDIVTEVRPHEVRAVGGNVSQTVDAKRIRTEPDGRLSLDGNQARFFVLVRCDGPVARMPVGPAQPPASGPGTTPATLDARVLHVMELLIGRYGYPVNGAAGLVGNLMAESAVLPNRIEDSDARTPMRAPNFRGRIVDFTPEEVMNRSSSARTGPRKPGIGLAQWTTTGRRSGLFRHAFGGRPAGPAILFDLEAQVDYLATELRTSFRGVNGVLRAPGIVVDRAADEVVYRFEVPGAILDEQRHLRPRDDPAVQRVFRARRAQAARALAVYRNAHPG